MMNKRFFLIGLLLLTNPLSANASVDVAGKVIFALGKVEISRGGEEVVRARKGTEIFSGDIIKTFDKGQAQIKFIDDARVSVRPNSEFKVSHYSFSEGEMEKQKSEFDLIRGGFRAVTGLIGKRNKENYKVVTPVGTIGIRGTDYAVMLCSSGCPQRSGQLLHGGLYVGVIKGGVTVENGLGSLDLDPNQYGVVDSLQAPPARIASPPDFLMFDRTSASDEDRTSISQEIRAIAQGAKIGSQNDVGDVSEDESNDKQREVLDRALEGMASTRENSETITEVVSSDESGLSSLSSKDDRDETIDYAQSVPSGADTLPQGGDDAPGLPFSGDSNRFIRVSSTSAELSQSSDSSVFFGSANDKNQLSSFYTPKTTTAALDDFILYEYGTATLLDYGYDPETGLSWGRWSQGSIDKTQSLLGGSESLALNSDSVHWIISSGQGDTVQLPLSGTRDYLLVGNTTPTDNSGNLGSLGSASLSANFEQMTVDGSLELSINNQIWQASQTGMSLESTRGTFFGDQVSVDINGTVNNTGTGVFSGAFVGQDASGAGMSYSLSNGETSVSGTAAFQAR